MRQGQVFQSRYLGKEDLVSPVVLTIKTVVMETLKSDEGDEDKAVMHFANQGIKPMILNKGNWLTLEDAYGPESDEWTGKLVEVFVDPSIMFKGQRKGGIRVRMPNRANAGPVAQPPANVMSYPQALAACASCGISKEQMVAALKAAGLTGYNPVKATPIVQELIDAATTPQDEEFPDDTAPEQEPPTGDAIPF